VACQPFPAHSLSLSDLVTLLNKRREKRYFAADSLANQLALV
jgi:hypothetical protein